MPRTPSALTVCRMLSAIPAHCRVAAAARRVRVGAAVAGDAVVGGEAGVGELEGVADGEGGEGGGAGGEEANKRARPTSSRGRTKILWYLSLKAKFIAWVGK